MPGRIHQAMNRANGLMERRKARLSEMVANGAKPHEAGAHMGLTKGQVARVWANIKADLGEQAR